MRSPALRTSLATAVLLAASLLGWASAVGKGPGREDASGARPNVILFLTDDQDLSSLSKMPFTSRFPGWTRFSRGYINNSLCCPSRATILSGQYSHHTRVEDNAQSQRFRDGSTVATWLDAAGYRTGLVGKYFNEYPWHRGRDYIPPGWDEWRAFNDGASYYDYKLNEDGRTVRYGHAPADYSTNVLGDQALQFIADAAPSDPFFLYFAPYGPHIPRTPAPGDGVYGPGDVKLPGNFNERNIADKPRWVKQLEDLHTYRGPGLARRQLSQSYNALLSVDRVLKRMIEQLTAQGEIDNTVIIFLSDNGFSYGSHRWRGKECMYEECNHVPYLVYDPLHTDSGSRRDALVSNVDLATTVADLAGATPTIPQDGHSLVPLLDGTARHLPREEVLFQTHSGDFVSHGWGLRTDRWALLTEDRGNFRELYDLRRDPGELRNLLHGHPAGGKRGRRYRNVAARLERKLAAERARRGKPPTPARSQSRRRARRQ